MSAYISVSEHKKFRMAEWIDMNQFHYDQKMSRLSSSSQLFENRRQSAMGTES